MKNDADRGDVIGRGWIRPRWITPSEICIILYIIGKSNSIIVLLFIQNIFKVLTSLSSRRLLLFYYCVYIFNITYLMYPPHPRYMWVFVHSVSILVRLVRYWLVVLWTLEWRMNVTQPLLCYQTMFYTIIISCDLDLSLGKWISLVCNHRTCMICF